MVADFDASEFFDIFVQEATELIDALDQAVTALEQQPDSSDLITQIFRSAHTLKASAASQGLHEMSRISHTMEDVFDRIRNGELTVTPELIDLLLEGVDALQVHLNSALADEPAPDYPELVAALRQTAEGAEPAAGPEPAEAAAGPACTEPGRGEPAEGPEGPEPVEGPDTIHLRISFAGTCRMPAVRALLALRQLESAGQVISSQPSREVLEQQTPQLAHFLVAIDSPRSADELVELAEQVPEVDQVIVISAPTAGRAKDAEGRRVLDLGPEARGKPPVELARRAGQRTIRVGVETIDAMVNLVGELIINRTRMTTLGQQLREHRSEDLADSLRTFEDITGDIGRVLTELQGEVMQMRMVPIEQVFMRFPRILRDAAREENKQVRLVIEGADTELDRSVIEDIVDPLKHIIRNCVGHGIEPPEVRRERGKPEEGLVRLSATQQEGYVIIQVADDGAGIDPAKLRQAAIDKGLLTPEQAQELSEQQALDLMFAAGFSTAERVTAVSGRGVGMDVVRTNLEKIGGQTDIESVVGEGTTVSLRVPLTRAIIQALLVLVDQTIFALPLNSVLRVLRCRQDELEMIKGYPVIVVQEQVIPLITFNPHTGVQKFAGSPAAHIIVVVVTDAQHHTVGLVVEDVITSTELVIESLGELLRDVVVVSGAAVLGDGRLALIVDPVSMTRLLQENQELSEALAA